MGWSLPEGYVPPPLPDGVMDQPINRPRKDSEKVVEQLRNDLNRLAEKVLMINQQVSDIQKTIGELIK